MTSTTSLFDAATELLVKSAEILATTPSGAYPIQYVSHGPPPYDCPNMLTVHAGMVARRALRAAPEGSSAADPRIPIMPQVGLTVTAIRCQSAQPSGGIQINLPTVARMSADAAAVYADGWALFNGVNAAYKNGELFDDFPCRVSDISGLVPIAPEGGCLGWSLVVTLDLHGYDPLA